MRRVVRRCCGMCWLPPSGRTGGWRRWLARFARGTRGCGRRTRGWLSVMRSRRLSLTGCGLTWRFCRGCCSGGRRSGRVRSRVPVMTGLAAGSGGAALAGAGRRKRGPGARAGRRDYSHLPRFKVVWDFPGGGYCCPGCGERFTLFGGHITELLDWVVIVRVAAHCRRRCQRACGCRVPAAVMAPGPPEAIGKGLFTNAFTAMLLTERYAAGRSMNSLVAGLARRGAGISPATLAGTGAQAGALLGPAADAITERSRGSWHPHADETTWRVFPPREGGGPAKWWLWVLLGPGTCCFVMDPTRSGAVLARHAGIDGETGQLTPDEDGGPRRLVISSDFYTVYEPAGKKADGWAQPPQQPG